MTRSGGNLIGTFIHLACGRLCAVDRCSPAMLLPLRTSSIIFCISPSSDNPIIERSVTFSPDHRHFIRPVYALTWPRTSSFFLSEPFRHTSVSLPSAASVGNYVEQLADQAAAADVDEDNWGFFATKEAEAFNLEDSMASPDLRHLDSPSLEVKDLDELPEKWRRSRLAWLCKQLPAHKQRMVVQILHGQRKWFRQDDATYLAVHCMRIRENETAFRVYKWVTQQHWFRFDFALATKLADYLARDGKFSKCRVIFDDIINQGRVPTESTFHCLIVAYLSSPAEGSVDEACNIYNRMIQVGGYRPRLALHNALFRALVSKPGEHSKHHLKQVELVFHNLVTSGLEIQKDIYGGLIWLHSYQDTIDRERIATIRNEMQRAGIKEGRDVLISILRACSKEGDVEEAERIWVKLVRCSTALPSRSFVYKMELYSIAGDPMKSLEIFREMQKNAGGASVVGYHKIIEVLTWAREAELAEGIMKEFLDSGLKPLSPSLLHMMSMYLNLNLHNELEVVFRRCIEKCPPSRRIYNIYLDSLVKTGNIERAEEIFNQMLSHGELGVSSRSCNAMLSGFLTREDYTKAEMVYNLMCRKRYNIISKSRERIESFLGSKRKDIQKSVTLKLSLEQREILMGLLLGGLEMGKSPVMRFEFNDKSCIHSVLKRVIYNEYHEWLDPSCKTDDEVPCNFFTMSHSCFGFFAEQFWPEGRPSVPKLMHRWMTARVLAYWYMYGGHRSSSGDVLLRLKGGVEDAERAVRALRGRKLDFRVKRKGRVFWIGFLGSNSMEFWNLTQPYVLDELKGVLKANGKDSDKGEIGS